MSATAANAPVAAVQDPMPGVSNGKLAMWLFLVSDAMSFIGLLAAYTAVRWGENWDPPKWFGQAGINLTAAMTFLLIVSSVTMVYGLEAFTKGDVKRGRKYLLLTAGGGFLFLCGQYYEWSHMLATTNEAGEYIKHASYHLQPATFYALTGFHGAHVTGGVLLLLFTWWRGRKVDHWIKPNTVECVGLYWHFVDLVWILIFTFVYLI